MVVGSTCVPDVVVAELGGLRPVQQHRPRRGVYGFRLGSGPRHLIVCLAVPGGRARGSCTVGWMGERRGWVRSSGGQREADRWVGGGGRGGHTRGDVVYSSKATNYNQRRPSAAAEGSVNLSDASRGDTTPPLVLHVQSINADARATWRPRDPPRT